MKIQVLLVFVSITFAACGGPPVENKNAEIITPKAASTATIPATPMPQAATPPIVGEKVFKQQTVRFPDGGIPIGWNWIDPDSVNNPTRHEMKNGRFVMNIPTGKDMYRENETAPRLLKPIAGDFQIETRLKFDPTDDYQGAGLLVYLDGENYLRLERSFGGLRDGGGGIRIDYCKHNEYESITTPGEIPTSAGEVELKVTRRLDVFSFFWRVDESSEWRSIEDVATDFPETIQAGVFGCSTGSEITAEFAYIRLSPQPVTRPF